MKEQTKGDLTRESIKKAMLRIIKGTPKVVEKGRKISIMAVAKEAGISRASIHNNYPDLAEKIRTLNGKEVRAKIHKKCQELKEEKNKNQILRREVQDLKMELAKLASLNASLLVENSNLKAVQFSFGKEVIPISR
jgi:AcrR family transcriptional regulator